ncbi:hypothetical protein SAMN05444392_10784 [Seinonella peptonophila]|uniref:Uncharacterized protein n=1 Tax=Seinonella peptonophila TaxID=112248 RepID=A0A1M4YQC7_9BACL|nr:hypothetical protein [Seinonella peptonophila]SHF07921.1 hypothetical protein SAMN05444392_10784 [Seinonella peptonophila]
MKSGYKPLKGRISLVSSLPNIREDEAARREWISPEQDAALSKLWAQMMEKNPNKYRDRDSKTKAPLKLYYHQIGQPDVEGNINVEIGEMSPKDFYPLDWLETNQMKKDEYNLSPEEWKLLESIGQKGLLNPSSILRTNDGKDNYGLMGKNTAVENEFQCIGAALQPIPGTDPPQFNLAENVRDGVKRKTALDDKQIGEVRAIGVSNWRKSDKGPTHTTVIYETQLPNKSADQLRQHVEEHSPQLSTTISIDPKDRKESREWIKQLPKTGQRSYLVGVVKARYLEKMKASVRATVPRIQQIFKPKKISNQVKSFFSSDLHRGLSTPSKPDGRDR